MIKIHIYSFILGFCFCYCPPNWEHIVDTRYGIIPKYPFRSAYYARESCLASGGDISDILNEEIYDRILALVRRVQL